MSKLVAIISALLCVFLSANAFADNSTPKGGEHNSPHHQISEIDTAELRAIMTLLQDGALSVEAQSQRTTVSIIYDGSRSMLSSFSEYHSRSKAEIAAEVFQTMLPLLSQDVDVDVWRFGGREQGSCVPILEREVREEIWSPSKLEIMNWQANANSRSDRGSPVAEVIWQAASKLEAHTQNGGSIVLLTDGRDQCEPRPEITCEVAKRLAGQGIKIHVLSVNAPKHEQPSLRCIADETNGLFAHAAAPRDVGIVLGFMTRLAKAETLSDSLTKTIVKRLNEVEAEFAPKLNALLSSIEVANEQLLDIKSTLSEHVQEDASVINIVTMINDLQAEVDSLENDLNEADIQIAELQAENTNLRGIITERDSRIIELTEEDSNKRDQIKKLHVLLKAKNEEIVVLEKENSALKERERDLEDEIDELMAEITQHQSVLLETSKAFSSQIAAERGSCNDRITSALEEQQALISRLDSDLKQCKADFASLNDGMHSRIQELQQIIDDLKSRLNAKELELEKCMSERETWEEKYNQAKINADAIHATLAELREERDDAVAKADRSEDRGDKLSEEIKQCETDLELAKQKLNKAVEELKSCRLMKDEDKAENVRLKVALEEAHERILALEAEVDDAKTSNTATGVALSEALKKIDAQEAEIIRLSADVEQRDRQIKNLEEILSTLKPCRGSIGDKDHYREYNEGQSSGGDYAQSCSSDQSSSVINDPKVFEDEAIPPFLEFKKSLKQTSSRELLQQLEALGSAAEAVSL